MRGHDLDEDMITRILNDVDEDKSGNISFTEFKKVAHIEKPDPIEFPDYASDDFTLEFLIADDLREKRLARAQTKRERDAAHHVLKSDDPVQFLFITITNRKHIMKLERF